MNSVTRTTATKELLERAKEFQAEEDRQRIDKLRISQTLGYVASCLENIELYANDSAEDPQAQRSKDDETTEDNLRFIASWIRDIRPALLSVREKLWREYGIEMLTQREALQKQKALNNRKDTRTLYRNAKRKTKRQDRKPGKELREHNDSETAGGTESQ